MSPRAAARRVLSRFRGAGDDAATIGDVDWRTLVDRTSDGRTQRHADLVFWGGPGTASGMSISRATRSCASFRVPASSARASPAGRTCLSVSCGASRGRRRSPPARPNVESPP